MWRVGMARLNLSFLGFKFCSIWAKSGRTLNLILNRFLVDSCSAFNALEISDFCHSGIFEHFDISGRASKMVANYQR